MGQKPQHPTASCPRPRTLSVVIPTLNEADALAETVRCARANPEVIEILVVDGGSRDATREIAELQQCRVLTSPPGRGRQLRLGAEQAKGEVVLFLHADTRLPTHAGRAALDALQDDAVVGGGFWKVFDQTPLLMRGSHWRCGVRLRVFQHLFGDQAIFVRRQVLQQIGGAPDWPLMEDFELCRRLRRVGRLVLADATVVTSSRRFLERGIVRTYWRMFYVWGLYRLGASPETLQRLYARK